jgi:hypothetical protein
MTNSTQGAVDAERSTTLLSRVLGWLTAGYPDGIPATDRFAVIALLKRRLTDEQLHEIVEALTADGSAAHTDGFVSDAEIEELTRRVLSEEPGPEDLSRVSARLAAAGWPLEGTV